MPQPSRELAERCVDTIRFLAADAVQQANSGHPGMPMGAADMAFVLWTRHLRFDPQDPRWLGRDRFVLSAGHGSMLLYALLHLAGFDMPMEEIRRFRQLGSRTPGHPEFQHTPGVEVTSGPLGQGLANAVGMALGQAMLSDRLGPGNPLEDARVFVIAGDGCMMEGVSAEAASFAGHNKLGRVVVLWDDNGITIDGKTTLSYSGEDVGRRFEGYGWQVLAAEGRDREGIDQALAAAAAERGRPSLLRVRTTIGYGAPRKAGTSAVHGAALGEEELLAAKRNLGWPESPRFLVPEEVRAFFADLGRERRAEAEKLRQRERAWRAGNPEGARLLDAHATRAVPSDLRARLLEGADGADSTRKLGSAVLQKAAALVPALAGGSADLNESNLTEIKGAASVEPGRFGGRNVHFGVREHAMGSIANGLAYDGLHIPYAATFLVFADYMRPPVRLAALSGLQVIYVWTHDSILLGEDGPTHQPVEHLTALRAIPNLHVVRPADGLETAVAWAHALERRRGPTAVVLTRQKVPRVARAGFDPEAAARGAYLVAEAPGATLTAMATGSELPLAQAALEILARKGVAARLVSVPCLACFEAQPQEYRESLLPRSHRLCAVEAGRGTEWWRWVGRDGLVVGIDGFGASAPEKALAEAYGLTPAAVAAKIERWLAV